VDGAAGLQEAAPVLLAGQAVVHEGKGVWHEVGEDEAVALSLCCCCWWSGGGGAGGGSAAAAAAVSRAERRGALASPCIKPGVREACRVCVGGCYGARGGSGKQ